MNTSGFVFGAATPLTRGRLTSPIFAMALCGLMAFTAPSAHSATITVTANAPDVLNGADGSCALREAIQNINNGADTYLDCANTGAAYGTSDTINIPAGTYTNTIASTDENFNVNGDLDITRSVAIVGAGAGTTIIDGGALDRVFDIPGAYTVSISGVTIQNGTAIDNGGGILNAGGTLTVTNSTITSNTANWDGGGIFNSDIGTLTVTNSTISGNTTNGWGGGIVNNNIATVTNSTITGNTAVGSGGGILNGGGIATITNCTISGNTAAAGGGGIYNALGGIATITNSTITSNTGIGNGGGILNSSSTVTVTNSTITSNTTISNGGGIYNNGTATVTNATIVRNAAPAGAGGGIFVNAGPATFANSIVADSGVGTDCVGAITDNGGNIDQDSTCTGFTHTAAMVQGTGFGALASNGGPTQTHALLAGSAAIDTAPTCAGLTTDQRGTARPQGSACDIGAYEYGAVGATTFGCTDYHATNYNPTATTGDGSCAYPDPDFGQVNLDFGTGKVDTSVQKTLTLKNTGPISTYVYGLHISGATFSIVNDSCSGKVVWLGNTCDIVVSFNPSSLGSFTGILKVWTNAPKYKPLSVSLTGKAAVSTVLSPATLITPADGATLAGTEVTFEWTAGSDATGAKITDNAYVCERADFSGCETPVLTSRGTAIPAAGLVIMLGLIAPFGLRNRRVRSVLLALIFLMAGGATLWACGGGSSSNADKSGKTLTLKAGTKYYWKVGTASANGTQESEVNSFTTGK